VAVTDNEAHLQKEVELLRGTVRVLLDMQRRHKDAMKLAVFDESAAIVTFLIGELEAKHECDACGDRQALELTSRVMRGDYRREDKG